MRKGYWLVGLTLALVWAGSAHAQSSSTSSSGSSSGISAVANFLHFPKTININVQPNITNNSAMDYRNGSAPISTSYATPNTTGTAFPYTLSSMFYSSGRTNYIASTTTGGVSTFPTPTQMQTAATSYFAPFQMYRAAPIGR
jgi:hypothetical protein